jgi:hypothetical protein
MDILYNRVRDHKLAIRAHDEFSTVADYIWKAPRLIKYERELELSKLPIYFPDNKDLAEWRWRHESNKLDRTFPFLIAVGNLFTAASLFEIYLLMLSKDLEAKCEVKINSVRGQGSSKIFNYMKLIGIKYNAIELYKQIDAALKIRNCLVHASGILTWSRDELELRRIYNTRTFLSNEHRKNHANENIEPDEVTIIKNEFGDRMQISNMYSFLVCCYFRDYFMELCIESAQVQC